jgi:hypothetical protein
MAGRGVFSVTVESLEVLNSVLVGRKETKEEKTLRKIKGLKSSVGIKPVDLAHSIIHLFSVRNTQLCRVFTLLDKATS